jgi:hypothetical protein
MMIIQVELFFTISFIIIKNVINHSLNVTISHSPMTRQTTPFWGSLQFLVDEG